MKNKIIPVFLGFDERFAKYASVALISALAHVNPSRQYRFFVLHTDITKETMNSLLSLQKPNAKISFVNVEADIASIIHRLPIRDYYSPSTYFRFLIASKFKDFDKALYIDSDTAVVADLAKMFDIDLGSNLVGAVKEGIMFVPECGDYVERVLGVSRNRYFNAGILSINCKAWRKEDILGQFIDLVHFYTFSVAQDQDYLNVICKDRVKYLGRQWNIQTLKTWQISERNQCIIHYSFAAKPWHDPCCPYVSVFWKYASMSPFYFQIKKEFASVTNEQLEKERNVGESVIKACLAESNKKDTYLALIQKREQEKLQEALEEEMPPLPSLFSPFRA